MSNLLEIYDLMEWGEVDSAKKFWAEAKENRIDTSSFRLAFYKELKELGLWKLFDFETSLLISKSSYGEIKKALDADPNNWALKALQKFWVLQFKNNAKTLTQIYADEMREREEQRKEQARLADEKVAAERALIAEKLPELTELANKLGLEFAKRHSAEIKAKVEEIETTADKIKDLTRDIIYTDNYRIGYRWNPEKEFEVTLKVVNSVTRTAEFLVEVSYLAGISSWYFKPSYAFYRLDCLEEGVFTKKFNTLLTSMLSELTPNLDGKLERVTKSYKNLSARVEKGRKAQAEVNAGKPTDPDFRAVILATLANGYKKASDEYDSWLSVTDGSSGAAFENEKSNCLQSVALLVLECNWVATKGEKIIASWNKTDSVDKLYSELNKLFSPDPKFDFELVK